jgi:capping protein alpha
VDPEHGVSFTYDHTNHKVLDTRSYSSSGSSFDGHSLYLSLANYVDEHFPSEAAFGVFPQEDETVAIVIVDSKYSPGNFWNGRWKSVYILDPSSNTVKGTIDVDVHYFEDGNVRLKMSKELDIKVTNDIVKPIGLAETMYQQEVNKTFVGLNEGSFKALRRQLPVTRSKMTWGKAIGNYRLGQDIGGGRT